MAAMPSTTGAGDSIKTESDRTHGGQKQLDGKPLVIQGVGIMSGTIHVATSNGGNPLLSPLSVPSPGPVPSPGTTMMSPRTPGMLSPTTSGGHDLVHDLPADLLHAGWRRFWSQREAREYFYNKVTRESRWEMPLLPGQVCL